VRYVLYGDWHDLDRSVKPNEFGKAHSELIKCLAKKFRPDRAALKALLPRLMTEEVTYPQHGLVIFNSLLERFVDHSFALLIGHSDVHNVLVEQIRRTPTECWASVTKMIESSSNSMRFSILHWLGGHGFGDLGSAGPLSEFLVDDVLEWVKLDPSDRAPDIIRECPKTLDTGKGRLTREMLIRYHHVEHVQNALAAHFGTGSWMGPASQHHRTQRDTLRLWLADEKEPAIRNWLTRHIDYLGEEVRREEMREEREF
jgi:hypothetical protein